MSELPELSEPTKRTLALQWDELLDYHHMRSEDLDRYASTKDQIRRRALDRPPEDTRYFDAWLIQHERARRESGISPSVAVAKARFTSIASEYWALWEASGRPL